MQNVNRARDTAPHPVCWHRDNVGIPRAAPHWDLARKHDILTYKWTEWLTHQWGPVPRGAKTVEPKETLTMPDKDLVFQLSHGPEGEISPYQPYPLASDPP